MVPRRFLFTLQYHAKMFPGVPIVFTGLSTEQFGGKTWPGVTGSTVPVGLRETIELALRLQPDTSYGRSDLAGARDPYWLALTHSELLRHKVNEIYFSDPPGRGLLDKVAALPPHTVVLFHLALAESGQPPLEGMDLLDAVAQRVPTYSRMARALFGPRVHWRSLRGRFKSTSVDGQHSRTSVVR